ncbi:hypothetical protein P2318_34550 [Myxococcaceae bacterium GXIMD 01537]
MNGRTAVLCALALLAMTGCPEEFGKEGRIHRAVHKDTLERLESRCSALEYERYCGDDRDRSPECLKRCGD